MSFRVGGDLISCVVGYVKSLVMLNQDMLFYLGDPVKLYWIEWFNCGCSNVQKLRRELHGYCPKHGHDRKSYHKIPAENKDGELLELGLAS